MTKERELLARALEELSSQDAALRQEFEGLLGAWGPLTIIEEIRNYLVEPTQDEPVAWTCQDELSVLGTDVTCYMYAEPLVGENNIPLYLHPASEPPQESKPIAYWDTQEGTLIPAVPLSSERTCVKVLPIPLYLSPTRPFIRLTDEEILEIVGPYLVHVYLSPKAVGGYTRKLFDTIQDKLEEKNK